MPFNHPLSFAAVHFWQRAWPLCRLFPFFLHTLVIELIDLMVVVFLLALKPLLLLPIIVCNCVHSQAGCVALMESVLMEPPCGDGAQYDVRQLLALCTLGLVAGRPRASVCSFCSPSG
jgi:hypothetical protein